MTRIVDLVTEEASWEAALPDLEDVAEAGAAMAFGAAGLAPAGYEIAVLACDDARIATLNQAHRARPQPTNVLSWPAFDLAPELPGGQPAPPPPTEEDGPPVFLGDVALALQTCQREAKEGGLPLKTHATHLILHSVLHLLGYDHLTDEDAAVMEGLESRAMIEAGFSDPYTVERDGPA